MFHRIVAVLQMIETRDQIEARLKAIKDYEASVLFSMPDEGDLTSRELTRIALARSKLRGMLDDLDAKEAQMELARISDGSGTGHPY